MPALRVSTSTFPPSPIPSADSVFLSGGGNTRLLATVKSVKFFLAFQMARINAAHGVPVGVADTVEHQLGKVSLIPLGYHGRLAKAIASPGPEECDLCKPAGEGRSKCFGTAGRIVSPQSCKLYANHPPPLVHTCLCLFRCGCDAIWPLKGVCFEVRPRGWTLVSAQPILLSIKTRSVHKTIFQLALMKFLLCTAAFLLLTVSTAAASDDDNDSSTLERRQTNQGLSGSVFETTKGPPYTQIVLSSTDGASDGGEVRQDVKHW